MKKNNISIIIPVYNSGESLRHLIEQLAQELSRLAPEYEVILVNDGSRDNSWQVIQELCQEWPWLHGYNLMRNFGQHNALLCGIRSANFPVIVTMDDDLQHPPDQINLLLEELDKGFDVVYGAPLEEKHNLGRDLASQLTKLVLQRVMGAQVARKISAFRAFRTDLRKAFENYAGSFISIDVLLTWGTTKFSAVYVRHESRKLGKSNYNLRKLITHALNMITGFSVLPLQIASMVGFVFTIFGILVLVYVLVNYLINGGAVPGFAFLASTIAVFSGSQLFALGIIGEYLARIHFRLMDKPTYIVREVVNHVSKTQAMDDKAGIK